MGKSEGAQLAPPGVRDAANSPRRGARLVGVASGAERDPVTDERADRERDPKPTQEHGGEESRPVHVVTIGSPVQRVYAEPGNA